MQSACSGNLECALRAASAAPGKVIRLHLRLPGLLPLPKSFLPGKAALRCWIRGSGLRHRGCGQRRVFNSGWGGAGGSRGMAPLCLRSAFPPRPRANGQTRGAAGAGSRGSCQRQVQGLLRVGLVCELARLGSCMDYSCWHPGKSLTAQRAAARQRNGSSLQPGALERQQRRQKPGWCWSSRPAPEPAGSVGRSLPAITEQLFHEAAAPGGPGAALLRAGPAQPICCRRNRDLLRGRRNPRRRGCAQALPRALPAKCCNPCAAIPAWCCDTDAGSEIQAPASSHSRGRCSSLARSGSRSRGLVRAQPRLFLAPLGECENAAGRAEL